MGVKYRWANNCTEEMMNAIVKTHPPVDLHELYILRMWIQFLRAPARPTREEVKRGGVTDLGEIGAVPETRTWNRETPYSPARRVTD
jgi:hypothetical protein